MIGYASLTVDINDPRPFMLVRYNVFLEHSEVEHTVGVAIVHAHNIFNVDNVLKKPFMMENRAKVLAFHIDIHDRFADRDQAAQALANLQWEFETQIVRQQRYGKQVMRIFDRKLYPSARAAARDNAISSGAMSNHLNRRPGYLKVHGLEFTYV